MAGMFPVEPVEVPQYLYDVALLARRYPGLRPVEFDLMPAVKADGLIEGYALEDKRIRDVPAGWHVYTVVEVGEQDDTGLSVQHAGDYPFARFDLATMEDLDDLIDEGRLDDLSLDDWGFTADDMRDTLHPDPNELDQSTTAWFNAHPKAVGFIDHYDDRLWLAGDRRRATIDRTRYAVYTPLLDGWTVETGDTDNETTTLDTAWKLVNAK